MIYGTLFYVCFWVQTSYFDYVFYQWYLSKGKEERTKATRGPFLNYNLYLINIGRLGRGIFFLFYNIFFSVEPKSQPKTVQLGIFYNVLSRLFTFTTVAMCLFTDFPAQSDRPDVTSEPTCNNLIEIWTEKGGRSYFRFKFAHKLT